MWGPRYGDESHYLRVYVRQLRQKLGDRAAAPIYILTEPGVGYRWLPRSGSRSPIAPEGRTRTGPHAHRVLKLRTSMSDC